MTGALPERMTGGQPAAGLPSGVVTFVFTDIEGSTRLFTRLGQAAYEDLLAAHHRLVSEAIRAAAGAVVRTEGDSFFAAFPSARGAVTACVAAQRALAQHPWPQGGEVRVRMGMHTGEARPVDGDYVALAVHRAARIAAAAHGGQVLVSDAAAGEVEGHLPGDVSLQPLGKFRLKDFDAPEPLRQVLHPALRVEFPAVRAPASVPHNLPTMHTSFVGRTGEIAELKSMVAPGSLVTIVGAGGAGKTRLGFEVVAEQAPTFPDGAWVVLLAGVTDRSLVLPAVAVTLGLPDLSAEDPLRALVDYLRDRELLLFLDNCEHVVADCALVAEAVLGACPGVTLLATSREALGIPGERAWRLPSLPVPPVHEGSDPGELLRCDSVRLFVDRAVGASPTFVVEPENAAAVAEICRRLDGIPLAIELAAARVPLLSPAQITARLDDRFALLTGGSRTAMGRQQTLRALIDWSHDLLNERERVVFRRVSAFIGGFTLEAAEGVAAFSDLSPGEVVDLLGSLVNKSLVAAGGGRYWMLETIRQYAREKLAGSEDGAATRTEHATWYAKLAEEWGGKVDGPDRDHALAVLEAEHENLQSTLGWIVASADGQRGLRLVLSLHSFWSMRGYFLEGLNSVQAALALPATEELLRGWAFLRLGVFAHYLGQEGLAAEAAAESLEIARRLDDLPGLLGATTFDAELTGSGGDPVAAAQKLEVALGLARDLGSDQWVRDVTTQLARAQRASGQWDEGLQTIRVSLALADEAEDQSDRFYALFHSLPFLVWAGDLDEAHRVASQTLAAARELRDRRLVSDSLSAAAELPLRPGEAPRRIALLEEALRLDRELGRRGKVVMDLIGMAFCRVAMDDYAAARGALEAAIEEARSVGDRCLHLVRTNVAELDCLQGDLEAARRIYERVAALPPGPDYWTTSSSGYLGLSWVAARAGRMAEATAAWTAAVDAQANQTTHPASTLRALATIALAASDPATALGLMAAAAAVSPLGLYDPLSQQDEHRIRAAAQAHLGPERCDELWAAGKAMSIPDAMTVAQAWVRERFPGVGG